jgi:thiol-disulfide isomerase/thioredoxin
MGKASRTKSDVTRREKIAAQRAAARRAERRRRILIASGSIVVVAAIVVAFVLVKVTSGGGKAAASSNGPTGAALTSLVGQVTSVPASTLDAVGGGSITSGGSIGSAAINSGQYLAPAPVKSSPLTLNGKPEFLYIGAEYCPYCAAQRWAMIVALNRFGTFSGLTTIHSSSTDSYPNTPTWTFYGSKYTSKYLSFVSVEETRNYRIGNSTSTSVDYVPLQTPTAAEQALEQKYNVQAIPFIDIGNAYIEVGNLQPYGPQDLQGKSWSQVAAALRQPSSAIAQGVLGTANYLTAAICKVTGNQPASACTPTVKALEAKLG